MTATSARLPEQDGNRTGGEAYFVRPPMQDLLHRNGYRCADDLFSAEAGRLLDKAALPGWRVRIALDLVSGASECCRAYLKRYVKPPLRAQLQRIFTGRRSTADVERYWIETLHAAGISVPSILAFCESTNGWFERRSAIMLSEVAGESLERLIEAESERPSRHAITASARFIAAFHAGGFIHRDLYASHVFVDGYRTEQPRFALIDLQRTMHRPIRFNRWRIRDLAQLDHSIPPSVVGLRDRLRWLKAYLGAEPADRGRRRRMIHKIAAKSAQIAAHDARRKRVANGA